MTNARIVQRMKLEPAETSRGEPGVFQGHVNIAVLGSDHEGSLPRKQREVLAALFAGSPQMLAQINSGVACADEIAKNWESGDLAAAVRALADWRTEAVALTQAIDGSKGVFG